MYVLKKKPTDFVVQYYFPVPLYGFSGLCQQVVKSLLDVLVSNAQRKEVFRFYTL